MGCDVVQECYPMQIDQYATFSETFQLLYLDNTPVDLTNWTARMQVRKSVNDVDIIIELSTADSTIIITGDTGTVQLLLPASVTGTLEPITDAVYDILLSAPSPDPTKNRMLQGSISVSAGVTR